MKFLSVFLIASLVVATQQQQIMQRALKAWRGAAAPFMNQCMCRSGTSSNSVEDFFQTGDIPNEPCFKCNLKCWAEQLGVLSPTGTVNITRWTSFMGVTGDIGKKCGNSRNLDLCERVYEMVTCALPLVFAGNTATPAPTVPAPVPHPNNKWYDFAQFSG